MCSQRYACLINSTSICIHGLKVNLPDPCPSRKVEVRLPPTINPDPKSYLSWVSPPPGWFYGNWAITYSSQPSYLTLQNFQYDASPVFPQSAEIPGQNNDLTSFQVPNSSTIYTAYGIDTPRRSTQESLGPEWDHVYDFAGTGAIAAVNNTWELLAWGYDTCGVGYMVIYETAVAANDSPSSLDIESRLDVGPSHETLVEIYEQLRGLGSEELTNLVEETVQLVQNGDRRGLGPVSCDAACINNTRVVTD